MDPIANPTDQNIESPLNGGNAEDISFRPEPEVPTPSGQSGIQEAQPTRTQPAATPPQSEMLSIREAARQLGYQLPEFADDRAALVHLLNAQQAARQNDFYTQIGRQIAPNYQQVQQWIASQRPQQTQNQGPKPWERPEFDEQWMKFVDYDQNTGTYVSKPGYDPSIGTKVQQFANWTQRFQRDPMSVLQPWLEDQLENTISRRVQDLVGNQFNQVREQTEIQQVMQTHANWLYMRDQNGNVVIDPVSRRPQASPEGLRYVHHLQNAAKSGIRGTAAQDDYAIRMLKLDLYEAERAQAGQQTQAPPVAATNRPNVNPGQTLVEPTRRGVVPGSTEPTTRGRTLAELLREGLDAEGITDADFQSPQY